MTDGSRGNPRAEGRVQAEQGQAAQARPDRSRAGQTQPDEGQTAQAQPDRGQPGQGKPGQGPPGRVLAGQIAPRNRWDHLDVPELGAWQPTRTLSVVIPYYQARDALEITLAALGAQTYPAELLQVVVADDGSTPPLELAADHLGLDVTVVRQDDLGFRLAAARNLGAEAADGDILVFLDGDMVAEPEHLEAHARWHHVCDHAVTLGFRQHVEFTGTSADDVARAARRGALEPLFERRERSHPAWLERHMQRMAELTSDDDDLFRAVTGGNLGVRAELFHEVGGFDGSFTQWGSEDTEIAQRLFTAGALLVPERRAACWHQGDSRGLEPHERASLAEQRAKVSQLVPHPQFRRLARGRGFTVPRVVIAVDTDGASHAAVTATLESVLASDLPDLEIHLRLADDHPDVARLRREWEGDPKVVQASRDVHARVPYHLSIPAGAALSADTLDAVVWQLSNPDDPVGVVRITLPEEPPARTAALAVSQRAVARARRGTDPDVVERAGELFGTRWLSGAVIGMTWAPVEELTGIARRRVRPRIVEQPAPSPERPPDAGSAAASGDVDPSPPRNRPSGGRRALGLLRRSVVTTLPAPALRILRGIKRRVGR